MTDQPNDKSITLSSPVDVARAAASLTLQEATNLGEINPAMARRFGERMDQIFLGLMRGAGVQWGPGGDLKIVYPEIENPILAAVKERQAKRELDAQLSASTALPPGASLTGEGEDEPS
jgi:hypothetical protein